MDKACLRGGKTMKKRMLLALTLICCAAVLCACQSGNGNGNLVVVSTNQPKATQNLNMGSVATDTPAPVEDNYDPLAEEGRGDDLDDLDGAAAIPMVTAVPTVRSAYAGATPVIIDPIDKPTPTPVPPISFTYQTYDATKLHLSFQGPVGWTVDDSASGVYVLSNPNETVDYMAALTLTASSVGSQLSKTDLKDQIEGMLATIKGGANIKSFSPSKTAERTLMDNAGIYANYTAVLEDGTQIAGRVHATCLNKVLYTVHLTYPRAYTETYIDTVYATLRKTLNITQ